MVIAAVPAQLLLIVLAAVALLLAYASRDLLVRPIAALLGALPFIGGAIRDALNGLGDSITNYVEYQFDSAVQGFTDTVDAISGAIQHFADEASKGIELLFGGLRGLQLMAQGIQRQLQQSVNDLAADATRALRDAGRALTRIAAVAADVAAIIATAIPRAIDQAVAGVRTFVRGIERDLQREIDNATGALRTAIIAIVASQIRGVEQWVSQLVTQVQRVAQEIEADLGRRIRAMEHELGHRLDGLARDLEGLQRQIGVIPLVGLVPWIQTIARDLTRITTECVMPQCRYLGPQLDALNAIQDVATIGIVTGAIAYAVSDPEGAAADLDQFLSGADDLAREIMRATTGVSV